MKKQIKQLIEFHEKFGVPINDKPTIPEDSRILLRHNLLMEENSETFIAANCKDKVEVLDGIIDSLYVLLGTALEYGMQDVLVDAFDEVHKSNMSKLNKDGTVKRNSNGKVIKGDGYKKPNLKKILKKHGNNI